MKPDLAARLDELTERVARLEDIVHRKPQPFYQGLSLTKTDATVLALLREACPGVVRAGRLADALGVSDNTVKVAICRLRAKLRPAVRIVTAHGEGYHLPEDAEARLAALEVKGTR